MRIATVGSIVVLALATSFTACSKQLTADEQLQAEIAALPYSAAERETIARAIEATPGSASKKLDMLHVMKQRSAARACKNNLRQLAGACDQYKLDHPNGAPTLADLVGPSAYIIKTPVCPSGGTYTINATEGTAACNGAKDTGSEAHAL